MACRSYVFLELQAEAEGEGVTGVPPARAADSLEIEMKAMKSGLVWSIRWLLENESFGPRTQIHRIRHVYGFGALETVSGPVWGRVCSASERNKQVIPHKRPAISVQSRTRFRDLPSPAAYPKKRALPRVSEIASAFPLHAPPSRHHAPVRSLPGAACHPPTPARPALPPLSRSAAASHSPTPARLPFPPLGRI